jgi:hypothetical protein
LTIAATSLTGAPSQRRSHNPENRRSAKGLTVSKLANVQLQQLFQLARQLLALEPQMIDGSDLLERFHGVFGITAMSLFDAATEELYTSGPMAREGEERTRAACFSGRDVDDPRAAITIRCLTAGGRTTGAIAFQGLEDAENTAEPLLSLVAALHERMRVRRKLGDELRNGLTAILAAAGGLREAGALSAAQFDMALMVEEEASRLAHVISWIARTDQDEAHRRSSNGEFGSREKAEE